MSGQPELSLKGIQDLQFKYKQRKHLGFADLRQTMSAHFDRLEDCRQTGKVQHSLHDALMSGFACMFAQDRSLLHFQQQLQEKRHTSNLRTLFRVKSIPQETQMRELIDSVESQALRPLFSNSW